MLKTNTLYRGDCCELMRGAGDGAVDVVLTDPPYLYMIGQKFDKPFDEERFFSEVKRVLKPDGFVVLFGRGTSFYRWNTRLADLGLAFKEEVVWSKRRNSVPTLPMQRVHELVSIHGNGKINKATASYIEQKQYDVASIAQDIKRIKSALNSSELDDLLAFISGGGYGTKKKHPPLFLQGAKIGQEPRGRNVQRHYRRHAGEIHH
jgi:site-specific DNA-methyltransferase (adenine-specific)